MKIPLNDLPIMDPKDGVVLFHPHVPKNAKKYISEVLSSRWLGQGPKVEQFEEEFKNNFHLKGSSIAVGSGTDALHLAYLLAGVSKGDEVLVPLFTCTATSIPLLYIGAKPIFIDVNPITLNISIEDLRSKVTAKTKAIVCVHYGGLPCDMNEILEIAKNNNIPVIEDVAHALGAKYDKEFLGANSDFAIFSFQAIKHLTTGDGGLLTFKDHSLLQKSKRLRWFGIDREDKQKGVWENDIKEVGYKYQMTDLSAALGIAALEEFSETLAHRKKLYARYVENLQNCNNLKIVDDFSEKKEHAAWLFTILVEDREKLQRKLRGMGVESGQTHYRNDRYSIFGCNEKFPGMDSVESKYLILPLHTKVTIEDVDRICKIINSGW